MADTLRETIAVKQISPGRYEAPPYFARARAGNAQPIAYGGIVLSQAVTAAFDTIDVEAGYHLFSVQGSYLGPSSTEVPTTFQVQDVRTTRSMATRLVIASQTVPTKLKNSSNANANADPIASASSSSSSAGPALVERKTLIAILDFHRPEAPFLAYSGRPLHPGTYGNPDTLSPVQEAIKTTIPDPRVRAVYMQQLGLISRMFESRPVPSSAGAQNALGFVKRKTTQDGLHVTRRTTTSWTRPHQGLETYAERCAGMAPVEEGEDLLAGGPRASVIITRHDFIKVTEPVLNFITDAALSFLPLTLHSIPLTLARAASSMDFSLRLFSPPPADSAGTWLLHEQNTEHASDGRSFGIARMFVRDDNAPDGLKEVARMTQVSILRGPEGMTLGSGGIDGSASSDGRAKL